MLSVVRSPPAGRLAQFAVVVLTAAVFAGAVAFVTDGLRRGLEEQVVLREAATLAAVAAMQFEVAQEELATAGADPASAILPAMLRTTRLRGVLALGLYDGGGRFTSTIQGQWTEQAAPADSWREISAGRPFGRWHPDKPLDEVLEEQSPPRGRAPLLEAWVPLVSQDGAKLAGAAQIWIEGTALKAELKAIQRRIRVQAVGAWGAGTAIIVLAFMWAFQRLSSANRQLIRRTDDLERANRELILAAKTSALGAVTAHLIHELKNPVAGLESLVASQAEQGEGGNRGEELAAASELTRRLRRMINDVVGVLRDEQGGAQYELTGAEIAESAVSKSVRSAKERDVAVETDAKVATPVSGRRGALAAMVLQNVIQNAIEASPPGAKVMVTAESRGDGGIAFEVRDSGGGLPPAIQGRLFQPTASGKRGGSGLGLALSHQLARQAAGQLELVRTGPTGTIFRLVLAPEG